MNIRNICEKRPFKTRNADEYSLADVFSLFVDPQKSLVHPFEFENNIVKGRMGSGKTMYLRANLAYYQYALVPTLLDGLEPIIPIYIKLSDYQNKNNPEELYNSILLRIMKEMIKAFDHLKDTSKLIKLHQGFVGLPDTMIESSRHLSEVLLLYKKLSANEFTEKVNTALKGEAQLKWNAFEASAGVEQAYETEYKNSSSPSIDDLNSIYNLLLGSHHGKLLILFDEAGSISRNFFKAENESVSYFEILMNQLRTLEYVRVKIAIYPQTVSDILTETRYGDVIYLQENIHNPKGFRSFYKRTKSLIERYLNTAMELDETSAIKCEDIFSENKSDPVEQLVNASNGNMRRLIQLMDLTMVEFYESEESEAKITKNIVELALIHTSKSLEELYSEIDKDFLNSVAKACKARGTYLFTFPNNATTLYKFTNKSSEYNPINIIELGTGRRGSLYGFDYAYSVYKGIPTHSLLDSEKVDRSRSIKSGSWISKKTTLSEDLLNALDVPGKLEGVIEYLSDDKGFIRASDNCVYYFSRNNLIEQDQKKYYHTGKEVRFFPAKYEDSLFATHVEIP